MRRSRTSSTPHAPRRPAARASAPPQLPTPNFQRPTTPNSQLPSTSNWKLEVGSGWELAIGSWELVLHVFFYASRPDFRAPDVALPIDSHAFGRARARRLLHRIRDERDHLAVLCAADAD